MKQRPPIIAQVLSASAVVLGLVFVGFELQEPARLPVPRQTIGIAAGQRSAAQVLAIGLLDAVAIRLQGVALHSKLLIWSIRGPKLNENTSRASRQGMSPHCSLVDDTAALKRAVDVLVGVTN